MFNNLKVLVCFLVLVVILACTPGDLFAGAPVDDTVSADFADSQVIPQPVDYSPYTNADGSLTAQSVENPGDSSTIIPDFDGIVITEDGL